MSNGEWRPKVGERVALNGVIVEDDGSNIPFKLCYPDGSAEWFNLSNLSPLPTLTAREPWEVLREAAEIIQDQAPDIAILLRGEAYQLEAAARPAPPTLAEAVRRFLDVHPELRIADEVIENMREALARAEAGQ